LDVFRGRERAIRRLLTTRKGEGLLIVGGEGGIREKRGRKGFWVSILYAVADVIYDLLVANKNCDIRSTYNIYESLNYAIFPNIFSIMLYYQKKLIVLKTAKTLILYLINYYSLFSTLT